MLAALARRARRAGVGNIAATHGDAERLPYPDACFDAVYLIGVLGEVPNRMAALREFRRVLKPDGRLVVGESFLRDPDAIRLATLRDEADNAASRCSNASAEPRLLRALSDLRLTPTNEHRVRT